MLIEGIHHVCIKCSSKELDKIKHFYGEVLKLPVKRSWGEGEKAGLMFDTGAGLIEVFASAKEHLPQGAVQHFALATKDVDACIEAVRATGYEITVEPKDVEIASEPPFPIRVAFAIGPVGEEIEFFCER